ILPAQFSIVRDELNLIGVCVFRNPLQKALAFLSHLLAHLLRKGLKWLDQQLCSRRGPLDLPDSSYKAIDQKSREHARAAWKDERAIRICYDAASILMGKDQIVKIRQEANRRGLICFRQRSAQHIEEFSPLLVAERGQFGFERIDRSR